MQRAGHCGFGTSYWLRLRNDLYCVEWGIKLYILTHSLVTGRIQWRQNEVEAAQERKKILVVPLHFFGSKSTISRFGERFRDGQCSLVSF